MVSPDDISSLNKENLTDANANYSDHAEHTETENLNSPTVPAETTPLVFSSTRQWSEFELR